ncbi:MAG: DNA repair protein RecN [Muribaculaceae bacterium]|nr:DNA repair protein RecN [Muribaculaceae bacterium]
MIKSLHISNYALISHIDIEFTEGLNIITGETGAGKSIMLGALGLILGARADAKVITDSSKKSVVEVEFFLEDPKSFENFFTENDLDSDGNHVILRRELSPNGRSRAFINDSPVNLNQLRELAIRLVDIHSQHQNLLLADPAYQLRIIDSLAGNEGLLAEYHTAFSEYQRLLKKYSQTRDMVKRGRAEADFISYQLEELDQMDLRPGEDAELESERDLLASMADIKHSIADAIAPMNGDENAITALETSADALRELSDSIPDAEALALRLDAALIEIRDIASSIEAYNDEYNADPERLDEIESRLAKIYSLETKHHVESADALIELRERLSAQIEMIENGDELLTALETDARAAKKAAVIIARRISEARQKCATDFAQELRNAAEPLGMKNLRCEIAVTTGKLNSSGMDEIEFLFSFNKNQPLLPVGQTASGGEISRLMLAIKSIVSKKMHLPSIIFDEIDTGVSGEVASKMGELMQSLGERIQVITITHLPQVAAKGKSHFKVYKQDNEHATNTSIRQLDKNERVSEIALMLSGSTDNQAAIAAAKSLFN